MGSATILDSYLVKLGFSVDTSAFSQFSNALREAASITDNQYGKMVRNVLGFQGAVTGAFFAAGAAAIDIADKVSTADQEYRLLALHLYTSLPVARELKIALDALGQPLENILYDPELARRFNQLVKDQRTLTKELGPDFEKQMLKIRDVRFEFTRFGVELQYLTMNVVQDLAQAFGVDLDFAFGKIRAFNDYLVQHAPEIAQVLANDVKPVLIDVKDVTLATVEAVKAGSVVFANLIGILANDQSLEGTAFSFDKIALAIDHASHFLARFIKYITDEEIAISHFLNALNELSQGHLGTAASEFKLGVQTEHPVSTTIQNDLGLPSLAPSLYDQKYVPDVIARLAHTLGVDPKLALAVAQQESGFRQYDKAGNVLESPTGALGIMQLLPSTARELGVDPRDPASNILGGVTLLHNLLDAYHGSQQEALKHYYGSKDAAANASYARQVIAREGGIQIDGGLHVTVNATTDASAKDIAHAMTDVLHDLATKKRSELQRNLAEQQTGAWGYTPSY